MKTLKEFINESSKKFWWRQYYESLCDFFNEDLDPNNIDINIDYILEALNSHDVEKLKSKLFQEFNDEYKIEFEDYDNGSFTIKVNKSNYIYLSNDKKFKKILEFYGYYLSNVDFKTKSLFIEPTYSKIVDLNEFHNICYHFTYTKNVDSILKNGLRCKKAKYRNFPERIFLYKTNERIFNNGKLTDKVKEFCDKILNSNDNISVLKIDFNHVHNIPIYKDTAMKEEEAIFTYHNIPAELIKLVKSF